MRKPDLHLLNSIKEKAGTKLRKYFAPENRVFHGRDKRKTSAELEAAMEKLPPADPETGLSRCFWLRAIGWFTLALADLTDILPETAPERAEIADIFRELAASLEKYMDPETGMYWQVVDQPGREGNYPETSGSSMIAYAMLKGSRLGVLDIRYRELGRKTFRGIMDGFLKTRDGMLELQNICLVAGLGPENNRRRDGSYGYYVSEPIVSNDAKGSAPFVLCYTEIKRLDMERQGG